ncbi:hypothetical protein ACFSSA_09085 [Luteolibacter algae]|uniref:Beta-ketoacyl synthase N-terminal domain-containing protein n=1 Tax=Luteolibacter algae TaxID=454151 RepID=A0ABW5D6V4_9BACT
MQAKQNVRDFSPQFHLFVHGHGAVSSAGINAQALYRACAGRELIPTIELERKAGEKTISYSHRPVDAKALRAAMPKHARLRRASNVSKYAVTAAHEAIGPERLERMKNGQLRIGIVLTFLNGCVNYSNRFFSEVLEDPNFASPILFPETVFNAPASHIAAYLECDGPVYTLIGDSATWFSALNVAEEWISSDQVDGCLVLCAEEIDWLTLEGLRYYSRNLIATEGAAAVYVEARPSAISVENIHGPYSYNDNTQRRIAVADAWDAVEKGGGGVLIDGLTHVPRLDRDELSATESWEGERISPAGILGEGMGIRCGFQTVAAIEALYAGHESALVLASGGNQHAFSAKFTRSNP